MEKSKSLAIKVLICTAAFSSGYTYKALAQPIFTGIDFGIHIPKNLPAPAPLVVMLHGCKQTAESFAASTRMNAIADKEGFVVLYPEQSLFNNGYRCWNWFNPFSQSRSGEAKMIIEQVEETQLHLDIDSDRIYVAGLSAGAAMSAVLLSCYSDVFSAGAIHSGVAFASAKNAIEAMSVMNNPENLNGPILGDRAARCTDNPTPVSVLSISGDSDETVAPLNSDLLTEQFTRFNDWADDGKVNQSISETVIGEDELAGPSKFGKHLFFSSNPNIETISIENLGHSWSGGRAGDYSDPEGPNASGIIWDFFERSYSGE